jgi:hypothetical protein
MRNGAYPYTAAAAEARTLELGPWLRKDAVMGLACRHVLRLVAREIRSETGRIIGTQPSN